MQIFNQLVFEGFVTGSTTVYSDSSFDSIIGQANQISIAGYTAQVAGTSPTLTLQLEHSFDQVRWQNRNATPEISATTLSTSAETIFQGMDGDPQARPALPFARIRITLAGTNPSAQVKLWATGRDAP